jgi:tetratricopeptide (TPR) repeat protein
MTTDDKIRLCNYVIDCALNDRFSESYEKAQYLLKSYPNDPDVNHAIATYLFSAKNYKEAIPFFQRYLAHNPKDISAILRLGASYSSEGTHNGVAKCRDLLLYTILSRTDDPGFLENSTLVMQIAAKACSAVGPKSDELLLRRLLAKKTGQAEDYFYLSECCAGQDLLEEAESALRQAIALDPATYDIPIHRNTLQILESSRKSKALSNVKKGRYPDTPIFKGDLGTLIRDHIAVEHKNSPKFINKNTSFFTMGSCFARNITRALIKQRYRSVHMDIAEFINTTFANRYFVDWLEDNLPNESLRTRIEELLPPDFSKEIILEKIRTCDVFILTLGVAPVFFDRQTDEFIMPRPTQLNIRALAEKYVYRTTTVNQNVENTLYLLSFVRKLSPNAKIIITVSPVPLHMTFEFDSAITADCLSKSVMRLTAHELVQNSGMKDVYYWPSFEVFRWAGSHAGPYFATDDGAAWHVSEEAVNTVIDSFLQLFSEPNTP